MNIQYVLPCYILLHPFFAVDSFTATGCSTIYPRFCYFALLPKLNIYHQNPFRIRRQRSGRIVERENYLSLYNDGVLKTSLLDDANDDGAADVVVVNDKDNAAKGLPTDKRNGRDQRTQQKQQKQVRHSPKRSTGSQPITSAILRLSYDGSAFSGWSDANKNQNVTSISSSSSSSSHQRQRRQRNRRRGVEEFLPSQQRRRRNVEGVLKENLAKLFGAVDPNTRIVVEGCSRTDKGVHASCMIAQVYCLKSDYNNDSSNNRTVICGKRIPHPATPTDDLCFEVLPMNQNLSKIAFSLNRMSPPDIQITGISPTPYLDRTNNTGPFLTGNVNDNGEKTTKNIFHASLSSKSKTYEYRISTGCIYDPCFRKMVWHVGSSDLNIEKMKDACDLFQGTHGRYKTLCIHTYIYMCIYIVCASMYICLLCGACIMYYVLLTADVFHMTNSQ